MNEVKITLRNPLDYSDTLSYYIVPYDNELAKDWITALTELLANGNMLEKNYCFLGFPKTARNLEFLCNELNKAVEVINKFNATNVWKNAGLEYYVIQDWFSPDTVRFGTEYEVSWIDDPTKLGMYTKHETMNRLHNHFERLQGTVWELSEYYKLADDETKYAIRQLNNLCHEIENLLLGLRKLATMPEWVRPSQITTFLHATRYDLKDSHRELFPQNGFDRRLGEVYMHWTQIGKTLYEVFRDEQAPALTIGDDPTDISVGSGATCEAITSLKYYSGEFDIEWAQDVTYDSAHPWHKTEMDLFYTWLKNHNIDTSNPKLSLGYLPIGRVDLERSFGTTDKFKIWDMLSDHLDIHQIEVNGVVGTFDYCWSDSSYKQMQIDMLKPGYDYSSRRG